MLAITARWPPKGVVNSQIERVCAFVDGTLWNGEGSCHEMWATMARYPGSSKRLRLLRTPVCSPE